MRASAARAAHREIARAPRDTPNHRRTGVLWRRLERHRPSSAILERRMSGSLQLTIELEREADGRWIAEVPELPGVLAYGATEAEATARVKAIALVEIGDRLQHGDPLPGGPDLHGITFHAA